MDINLQNYYEDRFTMMSTQGWKDLMDDTQNLFDTYNKINTVETFEEFHKRKGQIDILLWILSLKEVSEQSYKELQDEETI